MLKSLGIDYAIIGHSERRQYFSESEEILAKKSNFVCKKILLLYIV